MEPIDPKAAAGEGSLCGVVDGPGAVPGWRLLDRVARSRWFEVYRAAPRGAGGPAAPYALKRLRPEWESEPEAVAVLRREAEVGRSVSHPHVIPVLAVALDRPPRFLVTPWLAGTTLDRPGPRPLDLPEVLWMARQVAEGLAGLDDHGWTHGDVKPGNILVSPDGHVTLLDLGFARNREESGTVVDRCFLGTIHYVAPERITSTWPADIRSDLYSLGVVLYELLSGRLPFMAGSLAELAQEHCRARPPELGRIAPHLPRAVIDLVHQLLAKQPLRRPASPRELIHRLVALEVATFGERSCA